MQPKQRRSTSAEYRAWVKTKRCVVCNQLGVDPDHLATVGAGGSDFTCYPLCRIHHDERHTAGVKTFEARHRLNLWKIVAFLLIEYIVKELTVD
jgi:fructoselysine-6-P-deglycase FrlB-like protein